MRNARIFSVALLSLTLFSSSVWAWSEHHLITAAALKNISNLENLRVAYTELSDVVHDLGYVNVEDFKQALQINKKYEFPARLSERAGETLPLLDVLAKYSDEPDWGMDLELFDPDEYPGLWQQAYEMMGGKKGTPSQAFRHMYWQRFDLLHPLKTFKLPIAVLKKPLGQAPDRAAIFVDLSRRARKMGHEYWSIRFLADALHYLEDVAQPYHTAQVPTKLFLFMPIFDQKGDGFSRYINQLTRIISYYHFAFEDYVSQLMLDPSDEIGQEFARDLSFAGIEVPRLSYDDADIAQEVRAMARVAVMKSAVAGRASMAFFPKIAQDFSSFDPQKFMDEGWWEKVKARGRQNSSAKRDYFKVVQEMFTPLGYAIRQVVLSEIQRSVQRQ